jgi:hypothetical protein
MVVFLLVMPTVLVVWAFALAWRVGLSLWEQRAAERSVQPRRRQPTRMPRVKSAAGVGLCVLVAVTSFLYGMFSVEKSNDLLMLWRALDVWMLTAAGIAMVGLGIATAGLTLDPAYGRRRCAGCWYEFIMLASDATCPECGRQAKGERDLLRTRGSRGMVWLGLGMVVMSYAPVGLSNARAMGVRGVIPTTVLIAGYEWLPDAIIEPRGAAGAGFTGTLVERMNGRWARVWEWQDRWFRRKVERRLRRADSLEEACRVSMHSGVWYTACPAQLIETALREVEGNGQSATYALRFFQLAMMSSSSGIGVEVSRIRATLREAVMTGGVRGRIAAQLLAVHGPDDEEASQFFERATGSLTPGAHRDNVLGAYGMLVGRTGIGEPTVVGWSESEQVSRRLDAAVVLQGVAAMSQRSGGMRMGWIVVRLVGDKDVGVADAAMLVGAGLMTGEYLQALSEAMDGQMMRREVGRQGLSEVWRLSDRDDPTRRGVWFLMDEANPARASDKGLASMLSRARADPRWRECLEAAMERGDLPAMHAGPIRAELERLESEATPVEKPPS